MGRCACLSVSLHGVEEDKTAPEPWENLAQCLAFPLTSCVPLLR